MASHGDMRGAPQPHRGVVWLQHPPISLPEMPALLQQQPAACCRPAARRAALSAPPTASLRQDSSTPHLGRRLQRHGCEPVVEGPAAVRATAAPPPLLGATSRGSSSSSSRHGSGARQPRLRVAVDVDEGERGVLSRVCRERLRVWAAPAAAARLKLGGRYGALLRAGQHPRYTRALSHASKALPFAHPTAALALSSAPCRRRAAAAAVLGRFLHSLNQFCAEAYGMSYDVSDYWAYDFAKAGAGCVCVWGVHLQGAAASAARQRL